MTIGIIRMIVHESLLSQCTLRLVKEKLLRKWKSLWIELYLTISNEKSDNSKLDKYEMREKIENGIYKINLIRTLLAGCGYQPGYIGRSEEFLNSIERQMKLRGTLSIKQKRL